MTEMLNATFDPTPDQLKLMAVLPSDLQKQVDRLNKIANDRLPALLKTLRDAGVEVK